MILSVNRTNGTICGGGVAISLDPSGEWLRPWCLAAFHNGYELAGMALEVWDEGCVLGSRARTTPMLCLTALDAIKFVQPSVERERTRQAKADGTFRVGRKRK